MKKSKCRERLSLNSPYLLKDRSSKRNSIVIIPSWRVSSEKTESYHRRGNWKSTLHPNRLGHNLSYPPSMLLRIPLSFLKIIHSHLRDQHPPSPFLIKMVFKPEFQNHLFELFTYPWFFPYMHEVHMLINLFFSC